MEVDENRGIWLSRSKRKTNLAKVLEYFKQGAKTRVTVDASPAGLGVILEQKKEDGLFRPLYYASRKLSERNTVSLKEKHLVLNGPVKSITCT